MTAEEKQKLCLSCMECCKIIAFPVCTDPSASRFREAREFYETRGFRTETHANTLFVVLESSCQKLLETGCAVYEERPSICREYNGLLDPIIGDKCKWRKTKKSSRET